MLSRGRGDGRWVGRLEVPKNKNSNKKIRNHERISTTYERASTYTSPFSRVPACTEACTDSLDQIKQRDVPGQACGRPAGKRCEVTILERRERREASVSRASDWDRGEAGATGSASADCSTPHLTAGLEQTCTASITACKTMELAPPHLPVAALKLHHDVRMLRVRSVQNDV